MFIDVLQESGAYEAGIKGISLIFEMLLVILFIICSIVISKIEKNYNKSSLLKCFLIFIAFISGLAFVLWIIQFITRIFLWDGFVKYLNGIF